MGNKSLSAGTIASQLDDGRHFVIIRGAPKPEYMNKNA